MAKTPAANLLDFPFELQLEIIRCLEDTPSYWQDLCNWSCVSSHFRALLAPHLFTSITLCNTEKSGASVDRIANSKYGQYVRQLDFEGSAPGDREEGFSDTESILPEIVESILSDLGRFPNLESTRIHFSMESHSDWEIALMESARIESPEVMMMEAEQEEAWIALHTKVYAALAKNTSPGFKNLLLHELVPLEATAFRTPEFQRFLGQMTHFTLSFWEDEFGIAYHAPVMVGYCDFARKCDKRFFNHLSSVTHLSIDGLYLNLRLSGDGQPDLPQKPLQMPLLKSLHLESLFINLELVAFLTSHALILESVTLEDCHGGNEEGDIYWHELFTALARERPAKLREFILRPYYEVPLFHEYHDTQLEKDTAKAASEFLKVHPERRLFSYSRTDDKYGFRRDSTALNLASFRLCNDQRAYDELMSIVERNSAMQR